MKEDELIEVAALLIQKGAGLNPSDTAKELIDLVRGSEWISVEDELPEENTEVLATQFMYMDKSKGRYQNVCYRVDDEWFDDDSNDIPESIFTPTHWQPLPSPPTNKG